MAEEKRFTRATWQIMEQLLEVDNLEDALSGSLDTIVRTLNSEAGAIWMLDPKTDRLSPMFHIGPADISNITVENGLGLEGIVTKTGKSVIVEDAANDPRFDGTVFDDNGLVTKTMICVPLNNLHDVIGCRSSTSRTAACTTPRSCGCASAWRLWPPSPSTKRACWWIWARKRSRWRC